MDYFQKYCLSVNQTTPELIITRFLEETEEKELRKLKKKKKKKKKKKN